jgi:hypothetical protein
MPSVDRAYILGMCLLIILSALFLVALATRDVRAQHNHAAGHNDYAGWSSQKVGDCCNNQDCGELNDDEWRESAAGAEVKIDGQWCPVLQEHFIIKGKSPDWTHAHACVRKHYEGNNETPCQRLLCFAGAPKS